MLRVKKHNLCKIKILFISYGVEERDDVLILLQMLMLS